MRGRTTVAKESDSRRRILLIAREHFLARSFHGATLRVITREAGVTTGSFYYHFSGKDELFVEVCLEGLRNLRRRVETAAQLTETRPIPERVIGLFDAYAGFYLDERGYFELLDQAHLYAQRGEIASELAVRVHTASKQLLDQMVAILQQMDPHLPQAQAEKRVMFAVAMAEGLIACDRKGFLPQFGQSLGSFRSTMITMVERIILPEGP